MNIAPTFFKCRDVQKVGAIFIFANLERKEEKSCSELPRSRRGRFTVWRATSDATALTETVSCLQLTVPAGKSAADFHRQIVTHAEHTLKAAPP